MKVKTMQLGKSRKIVGAVKTQETWLTVKLEYEDLLFSMKEIEEADGDLEIILDKLETTERERWSSE